MVKATGRARLAYQLLLADAGLFLLLIFIPEGWDDFFGGLPAAAKPWIIVGWTVTAALPLTAALIARSPTGRASGQRTITRSLAFPPLLWAVSSIGKPEFVPLQVLAAAGIIAAWSMPKEQPL